MSASSIIKEVIIAGGGVMGMSTAFNLTKFMDPAKICILEPDPTYVRSASALSWASVRQQFSLLENIRLSQSSVQFIKNINDHLGVDKDDPVDINFKEGSYLFIAKEETAHLLEENISTQKAAGVNVNRYTKEGLKAKYPYMNCEDISLGADCDENEGWFDPWLLLSAYKNKIKDLGVEIRKASLKEFSRENSIKVEEEGKIYEMHYSQFVNATGIHAQHTNNLLNKVLPVSDRFVLPVTPLMRQTYNIACKEAPKNVPLTCCPLRTTIRSEGPNYIVLGPHFSYDLRENSQELTDFGHVDDDRFVNEIWEPLAYRFPVFEASKILGGWVGYYEFNTLDQNALIGKHPLIDNHYNINGFSGHGIQQSPAAGQCLAEMICGVEPHIDIAALGLQRVLDNKPYTERNII